MYYISLPTFSFSEEWNPLCLPLKNLLHHHCSWMTLDPIKAQGCIQISQTTAEGRSDSLWIVSCPLHLLCLLSTPCKPYIIRTVHAPCPTLTNQSQFPLKSYYNIHLLPFAANILIRVLLLLTNQYECILSYLNCLAKRWLNMIFFLFEVIEKWERTHTETPFLQRLTALFLPLSLSLEYLVIPSLELAHVSHGLLSSGSLPVEKFCFTHIAKFTKCPCSALECKRWM